MKNFFLILPVFLSATITDIDGVIQDHLEKKNDYGLVVGIVSPHGRRTLSYGTLSKRSLIPVNRHTEMRLGSLTQTFTATLLSSLVKEGLVSLDDPVEKFLPRSIKVPAGMTIEHLVTHTSGLPDIPYDLMKEATYNSRRLFHLLSEINLMFEPGTERAPSNVGYALLTNLMTRITKQTFPCLMEKYVFGPIGMYDSTFLPTSEQRSRLATGYIGEERITPKEGERLYSVFLGSGGLCSTGDDMVVWLASELGHHDGEGFEMKSSQFGFSSYMALDRSTKKAVFVLSRDGSDDVASLGQKILNFDLE